MTTPPDPPAPPHRNPGIDTLRGVSIVLVVLHHLGLRIALRKTALLDVLPKRFLNGLNFNGTEAVFLFFVISGFLIAHHSVQRWGALSKLDARAFYARRVARIAPSLLALLVVSSVVHLAGVADYTITRPSQSLGGALGAALTLRLNVYEGHTGYLPPNWDVLWSLSIEELFYLAFPIVCLVLRGQSLLIVALLALALSLPWTRGALEGDEIWQEKATLPGMSAIAAGVLGALLVQRNPVATRGTIAGVGGVGVAGILAVLFAEDLLWPRLGQATLLLLIASAVGVLVAMTWRARIAPTAPLAGLAWLRSFGRLSYEVYLTHMFVVMTLVGLWKGRGGDLRLAFLWYLPAVPLCWGLGWLWERAVSGPCDRALRGRWLEEPATLR